jgi:hypothetical protein
MDFAVLAKTMRGRQAQRALPPPEERRRIREHAGFTRADVAQILQTNPGNVVAWERPGGGSPRGDLALHYLMLLRMLTSN